MINIRNALDIPKNTPIVLKTPPLPEFSPEGNAQAAPRATVNPLNWEMIKTRVNTLTVCLSQSSTQSQVRAPAKRVHWQSSSDSGAPSKRASQPSVRKLGASRSGYGGEEDEAERQEKTGSSSSKRRAPTTSLTRVRVQTWIGF